MQRKGPLAKAVAENYALEELDLASTGKSLLVLTGGAGVFL